SSTASFKALDPGEPFFFRLKSPHNAIGGFGYFALFSGLLPVSVAWEVYDVANGAPTYEAMRERLLRIRKRFDMESEPKQDFKIGCVLLTQSVFLPDDEWVRMPADFAGPIVQGKTYDLSQGEGERIWLECLARSRGKQLTSSMIADLPLPGGYGAEVVIRPRLGQRSFRIAVLDSY